MTPEFRAELIEAIEKMRRAERGYRERGFYRLADDYLPSIAKYEAMLQEKVSE